MILLASFLICKPVQIKFYIGNDLSFHLKIQYISGKKPKDSTCIQGVK